jgi:1-acyl-sn-glycerol-3-phosphate acyltransferase
MMRRNIISKITQIFQEFLAATLYYIGNSKTIIHCENPKLFNTNERGILLVSNHRTVIDWMYVGWCYGSMMNFLSNFKVILKNALRNVPIFGWLMQLGMYIFLERHRDKDVPHISKVLSYLLHLGSRPSILIFPEGTDLSESNVEKSNLYAKENNLSPFYYVLRPKSTGLLTILNVMSQQSYDVHDVTVAYIDYEEKKRPGALSILFGNNLT